MKKFFLFVVLPGMLLSCSKKNSNTGSSTENEFNVSYGMLTLKNDSGSSARFFIQTPLSWKIDVPAAAQPWLRFSQTTGAGNTFVDAIAIASNHLNQPRFANVAIIATDNPLLTRQLIVQQNDTIPAAK